MQTLELYKLFLSSTGVTTDTRNIQKGNLFFALKGGNFNGNQFAEKAIELGAMACIVDEKPFENKDKSCFLTAETSALVALQELAKHHRSQLKIPIIGLTGSNGKTTTKELINAVLSQKFDTLYTYGNLNNHIGVPLTLLSIKPNHELAIVEMGANHQKEIEFLSELSQPDIGYITNFGKAHLEGFGGVLGVIAGKSELYQNLRKNGKTALINLDDPIQVEKANGINAISFGASNKPFPSLIENPNNTISVLYKETEIHANLSGDYNFTNICAAITLGEHFGLNLAQIKKGIESYIPQNNRSQISTYKGYTLLLDAYNANPSSMALSLENFAKYKESKTVILGDMFELGESSQEEHQTIFEQAKKLGFDQILLVGEHFSSLKDQKGGEFFAKKEDLVQFLKQNPINSKNILIKGSRGMALETLMESL
ncbi:MAG: UDP-N-acetylmuramoyl-tripeptide--D-alanyl-D-alanine ligase [Flavobacteriaceae bacterium]|nr:MAG: UDP-N-acetylmuramoyl-tripeptide--D-alanyl-D-alanine ligase [Flavobacteriaceae bacterium]